jgi:hypothetical protein
MAKKKINVADLVFKIGDDGSLKIFEGETKKAGKAVDKLSKSEATLNRNFKGASQQSSNQTKNFSKMAQGITGGLVPAYATLAANIFAIGAAFRFLQNAADLRILEQGQAEYAARTGQNLSILTRQLQAATDGQLAFAEAAQSAAIGTAAGLSAKQINELGVVAKNASLMLGRDLTDSFNRLVRGAVKAEPELLDELGIILRLETASEKYALSIGKTKDQLNIFEKSQAVVNEVLAQGLEKFGAVDTQTNSLTKLAKSFDDLVNSLKRAIGPMAEFMAVAMSQNTAAVAGAGLMLGTGVARAVIPKVPDVDFAAAGQTATDSFSKIYKGKRDIYNLDKKGLDALVRDTKRAYANQSSTVIRFNKMKKAEALKTLEVMKLSMQQEEAARAKGIAGMTARYKLMVAQFKQENTALAAHAKAMGTIAARAFSTALRFVGYAGIVITVAGVLGQYLDKSSEAEKKTKARQKEFGTLFSRNAEDLEKMVSEMKTFDSLMTNALQSARALTNIDYSQASKGLGAGLSGRNINVPGMKEGGRATNIIGQILNTLPGVDIEEEATLSADQLKGLRGIQDILAAEIPLLLQGSEAYNQHKEALKLLLNLINNPTSTEAFNGVKDFLDNVGEDGTIASKAMKGLGQTTQILSSSAQDFNKALASFKTAQTPLTRLTTNIDAVGGALSGLGEKYAKMQVKLKFKPGGTVFDKATTDMLKTFIGEADLQKLDKYNKVLNDLALSRDKAIKEGKVGDANKLTDMITRVGSQAFTEFGELTQAEAKRLADIEMTMIKDKTKVQKNLALLSVGATKNQEKQLKMQGASAQNLLNIRNQETLLAELKKKGLTMDDAQVMAEQEKLDLLHAQQIQLEKNLDTQHQIVMAMKNATESGLQSTFDDLMTGKNSSLSEGLANVAKGVFEAASKQLSEQMATGVTNFLFGNKELEGYERGAEIIRQAHIEGITLGMGGNIGDISSFIGKEESGMGRLMNIAASMFGLPKFAKGGITPVYAASGGVYSGSNSGYPAVLHGNEAVVPLPDGKSIPVSGGMGGNVTVNLNMTTGESSSETDSAEMIAIGESVAQAVQNELEKQQRPGGMLSPY